MSSIDFQVENPEQKEMRKKILELASQEVDIIQTELYDWKTKKFSINPGSVTTKSKHSSIFDEKIEEIQNKLKSRKGLTTLKTSSSNFDQKASQHSSLLTQELYTKQLQLFHEKHEIEVKDLKNVSITQESLQKENNSLRKEYETLLRSSRNPGKAVKKASVVDNNPKTEDLETLRTLPGNTLAEQKDKIEWELRKLGITSQRRSILATRLQEITIQLENQKQRPRLPLFI